MNKQNKPIKLIPNKRDKKQAIDEIIKKKFNKKKINKNE